MHLLVLSAFRREYSPLPHCPLAVSMHLLVLSAFRPTFFIIVWAFTYSVSMHLLVLSAFRLNIRRCGDI